MEFHAFGVQVKVGFLFAFLVCCLLCFSNNVIIQLSVLFSLFHECGHLLSDCLYGVAPQAVKLGLFGMTIQRADDIRLSYRQEIRTALAGPFVNLAFCILFFLLWYFFKYRLLFTCGTVNLCIFLFNAMPVYSLDGGRALEAYLFEKHSEKTRVRIMFLTSLACTALVMGTGFFFLFQSGHNFSLLLLSFYLIGTLFKKCGT